MKWSLNVSLKYLTRFSALRDSRSRSPLCIFMHLRQVCSSVLVLAFLLSSTAGSNQSSINSSYLNQKVDPSKSVWNLCSDTTSCCPVTSRLCATCSSRRFVRFISVFLMGSHQHLPHSHSSLVLLKFSSKIHSRETLYATRSSSFHASAALRNHFVAVDLFFLCRLYVKKYSRHQTRTHKNCKEFFLSWIVSDKEVRKMMTTRIVSVKSLFVTVHTNKFP